MKRIRNKLNYYEYIKSSRWKKKRIKTMNLHGDRCCICGNKRVEIHHKTYKDLGEENERYHLIPLCREHHESVHDFCKKEKVPYYKGTEIYLKKYMKKPERKWELMTQFQRELFIGRGL